MIFVKPGKIISGFHAQAPDAAVPELFHAGEQWAPEDYAIPRHAHAMWEFYLQLDGWSLWQDGRGQTYRCPPGAFYAPPPGLEHWLARTSRGKHHFLYAAIDVDAVVKQRLPMLAETWRARRVGHVVAGSGCEATFRQLIREIVTVRPFRSAGLRTAVDALVIDASRLLSGSAGTSGRSLVPVHPGVMAVLNALDSHPGETWQLADLGKLGGLSPNHLLKLFTHEVGVSPRNYLLRRRIDRAKEMLRVSDVSVTTLALELGFNSSQHFARVFKQNCRMTASSYRARNRRGVGGA